MSMVPPPYDSLDHAEDALRRTLIPDGPSEETVSRTLAALNAKASSDRNPSHTTTLALPLKIAAAVLVATGGVLYFAIGPTARATAAFAEVAQKLRDAHTLSYRATTLGPDFKTPLKLRSFFKEPKWMRSEVEGGMVSIVDGARAKVLLLDPAAKSAVLLEGKAEEPAPGAAATADLIKSLRQLTEGEAKPVGDKAIGAVQARGYLVQKLGMDMTIWVDPETRLPLRIECIDRSQGKEIRLALTDFQIDTELDDAMFSVEPPVGYVLRKDESKTIGMDEKTFLDPEKAAVDLLRIFTEKSGGILPNHLDDPGELDKVFPKPKQVGAIPSAEVLRMIETYGRFMMASRSLKGGFGYTSDGVKLGDADKIVFWYRPEGAANYRVIYGDLHAGEVPEDKLPKKPKA